MGAMNGDLAILIAALIVNCLVARWGFHFETGFQCSISDTTGLLVTYVGPDSCELSRLPAAIRESRRRVDPAE